MLRLLLIWICLAGHAQAGAWPRDVGDGFLSFSTITKDPQSLSDPMIFSSLYAEYGLHRRLTLGLDAGYDDLGQYKAILFVTRPIDAMGDRTKLAFEFGAGAVNNRFVLRPGLSIGRGVTLWQNPGWLALDTRAEIRPDTGHVLLASDITLGVSPWDKSKIILQIQAGGTFESPPWVRLAPSFVHEIKPGRHLEIGVTAGLQNAESFGFKVGFWREF